MLRCTDNDYKKEQIFKVKYFAENKKLKGRFPDFWTDQPADHPSSFVNPPKPTHTHTHTSNGKLAQLPGMLILFCQRMLAAFKPLQIWLQNMLRGC